MKNKWFCQAAAAVGLLALFMMSLWLTDIGVSAAIVQAQTDIPMQVAGLLSQMTPHQAYHIGLISSLVIFITLCLLYVELVGRRYLELSK